MSISLGMKVVNGVRRAIVASCTHLILVGTDLIRVSTSILLRGTEHTRPSSSNAAALLDNQFDCLIEPTLQPDPCLTKTLFCYCVPMIYRECCLAQHHSTGLSMPQSLSLETIQRPHSAL